MGALEDLAASLMGVGGGTEAAIKAENPYYQFGAVPQVFGQAMMAPAPKTRSEMWQRSLGASMAGLLGAGLQAKGDQYQDTLMDRYAAAAASGVRPEGLPLSLFNRGQRETGLFKLQRALAEQEKESDKTREVDKARLLEIAKIKGQKEGWSGSPSNATPASGAAPSTLPDAVTVDSGGVPSTEPAPVDALPPIGNPNDPYYQESVKRKETDIKFADDLRKEFTQSPSYKTFEVVEKTAGIMSKALKDKTAMSDQELVRYSILLIEPGMAVREGEQNAVAASQSIPNKWKGAISKALSGDAALQDDIRNGIRNLAARAYEGHRAQYDKVHQAYITIGKRRGVDPVLISPLGFSRPVEEVMGLKKKDKKVDAALPTDSVLPQDEGEEDPTLPTEPSPLLTGAKQFGTGAALGTAGLLDLGANLSSLSLSNPVALFNLATKPNKITDAISPYLPQKEGGAYDYARTAGEFLGPNLVAGGVGGLFGSLLKSAPTAAKALFTLAKTATKPGVIMDTLAAAGGSQAAKNLTDDNSKGAPIVGAVIGALTSALGRNSIKGAFDIFKIIRGGGEIPQWAGKLLKDYTGLSSDVISEAIKAAPDDALSKFATTAEITQNPAMAQIEKVLGAEAPAANAVIARQGEREAARQGLLSEMAPAPSVSKEELGKAAQQKVQSVKGDWRTKEEGLWNKIPTEEPIDVTDAAVGVLDVLKKSNLDMKNSEAIDLVSRFTRDDSILSSGEVQELRSEALRLLRDKNTSLSNLDRRALVALGDGAMNAMDTQLTGDAAANWEAARGVTKESAKIFKDAPVGKAALSKKVRPTALIRGALKGEEGPVKELKAAIGDDPKLIEGLKTTILNEIPKMEGGGLSPKGMANFLSTKENAVKELFGAEHFKTLQRISQDLASEAGATSSAAKVSGNALKGEGQTFAGALQGALENPTLWRLSPMAAITAKVIRALTGTASVNRGPVLKEALLRAAMNPEYAKLLASSPSPTNFQSIWKRVGSSILSGIAEGSKAKAYSYSAPATKKTANEDEWEPMTDEELAARDEAKKKSEPMTTLPKTEPSSVTSSLIQKIIKAESNGNPKAISPKGAQGLMQIMPKTWTQWAPKVGVADKSPLDREANQKVGTAYISWLLNQFGGNEALALAAYNHGIGNVQDLQKRHGKNIQSIYPKLPKETKGYLAKILGKEFA